jgi:hypothetical protein
MESYRALMSRLAAAESLYAAERDAVQKDYDEQCAAAVAAAEQARAAMGFTAAGVRAATAIVEHVDEEAAELWYALRSKTSGRLRTRLGVPPEPAPPTDLREPPDVMHTDDEPPEPAPVRFLSQARSLVARARRREPLAARSYAILPLLGAIGGAFAYLVARAILLLGHTLHGPPSVVLTAVGQIGLFASPLAGLLVTPLYTERRGARLDAGVIGMVVLGGMLTVAAVSIVRG